MTAHPRGPTPERVWRQWVKPPARPQPIVSTVPETACRNLPPSTCQPRRHRGGPSCIRCRWHVDDRGECRVHGLVDRGRDVRGRDDGPWIEGRVAGRLQIRRRVATASARLLARLADAAAALFHYAATTELLRTSTSAGRLERGPYPRPWLWWWHALLSGHRQDRVGRHLRRPHRRQLVSVAS